jgi:hypothetical protein
MHSDDEDWSTEFRPLVLVGICLITLVIFLGVVL